MLRALSIDLIDDCVFSARAATEGGHESLDRVPGAALLGAAASRLYGRLSREQAFAAFHSGRLRFGDGLPWDGRRPAWPVPLAWHHAKGRPPEREGRLEPKKILNFQHPEDLDLKQPKQLRSGYVSADGRWIRPAHGLRLKTAISPETGRAEEGHLFGYDALYKGQGFLATLEADEGFEAGLFDQVADALVGEVLLGRSRSAEYGRARIRVVDWAPPPPGPARAGELTLWLLSDLCLADRYGQPILVPSGEALGLPGAEVQWDRTFLRGRRYSPWNAARGGFDHERLVLSAGGVIGLALDEPLSEVGRTELQQGMGLYREAGLGRIWVDPPLLAGVHPELEQPVPSSKERRIQPPDHPLVDWLLGQAEDWRSGAEKDARDLHGEYRERLDQARRAAGVSQGEDFGPSRSQWGRVLEAGRSRSGAALYGDLFEGDSAIIKAGAEGWREEVPLGGGRWQTLAECLKEQLAFTGDARVYAHRVRMLAHRVRDDIDKRRV